MRYPAAAPGPAPEWPTQHLVATQGRARRAGTSWRRSGRGLLPAAAGLLVIVAAILIGSVIEPGHAPRAGTVPSLAPSGPAQPGSTGATTVDVKLATLVGHPVRAVAHLLRQHGLAVRIRWRYTDGQPPGTVLSARPAGQRPVGSRVTLVAALKPQQDSPPGGDQQGGDGQNGDGQGGDGEQAGGQGGGARDGGGQSVDGWHRDGQHGDGISHPHSHPAGNFSLD
ncbi:MAG: PASTA domain-containing protein, partial [Actinobacteria bacterium]|nr:PASTA domain-containing protein [Actinomycetota bacterium]